MNLKTLTVFALAGGLFLAVASYRFHDSAHAIGRLSEQGGQVNHAVLLDAGRPHYTIIVTGVVIPPYRGNARVALEGDSSMEYRIHNSEPVVDLGFFRRPQFRGNTLYGLQERDKVALWVVMRPKDKARPGIQEGGSATDDAYLDCCDLPPFSPRSSGQGIRELRKGLSIAFRDILTGKPILNVPIVFRGGKEETSHGAK